MITALYFKHISFITFSYNHSLQFFKVEISLLQDCLTGPNYLTRYCLAISLGNLETQECFLFILCYVSFAGTGTSYLDIYARFTGYNTSKRTFISKAW